MMTSTPIGTPTTCEWMSLRFTPQLLDVSRKNGMEEMETFYVEAGSMPIVVHICDRLP